MDDDTDPQSRWLDARLAAAARDAHAVPRKRRVLMTTQPATRRRSLGWARTDRVVLALVALNAATGAAVVALGLSLSTRSAQSPAPVAGASPMPNPPGDIAGSVQLDLLMRGDFTTAPQPVVAFGSVWVPNAGSGTVIRVDEHTLRVAATIAVDTPSAGGPTGIATDGMTIWATSAGSKSIVRIDPGTDRVVDSISVGGSPVGVAVSGSRVWVTTASALNAPGTLVEINAVTRQAVRHVAVGSRPVRVAVTTNAVWVVNEGEGTLSRFDTASRSVTTSRPNPADYDFGYVAIAADSSGAWAVDNNRAVLERVDGTTMIASQAIGVVFARTTATSGVGPTGLAVDGDNAWVVSAKQLVKVGLRNGTTMTMDIPSADGVAVGDGAVWVLAGDRTQSHLVKVTPRS